MGVSWVAGSVRGRALARRRLGRDAAREVAASPSLTVAVDRLARSPYARDVHAGQSLVEAQQAVAATALWHLRVLAGWLPRGGADVVRTLAGPWEIANVTLALASLEGAPPVGGHELGTLASVSRRLADASTSGQVRRALTLSPWGDPGSEAAGEILGWMRMRWAERVARTVPGASDPAVGYLALLVARALFVEDRRPGRRGWPTSPLGTGWERASSIPDLAARLRAPAREALAGVGDPSGLWSAEARWLSTVERGALARHERFRPGSPEDVVASVAILGLDAWRTRAALEVASRGGRPMEVFDALG